ARFALGHGLAVDRPHWSDVEVLAGPDALHVEVTLTAPPERRTGGMLHDVVQVYAQVPEASFSRRPYAVPTTRLIGFDTVALDGAEPVRARIEIPYHRLALFAPDREGWELPDGPLTVQVARSSRDVVASRELTIPRAHVEAHPVPAASGGSVPAARAEETAGLARCAATLLEGTELRPVSGAPGTADFVLDAGTTVTALETRPLEVGALEPGAAGAVELIAPEATDPSAAPPLPLPHRVPALGTGPTGWVRVRITGPLALTGLRVERP